MTINEVLKKPVDLVIENNINEDITDSTTKVFELYKRISTAINQNKIDGFLIVYLDTSKNVKAVVTNKELSVFIDALTSFKGDIDVASVDVLDLPNKFPPKFVAIKGSDVIEKVFDIFRTGLADTVIVEDLHGNYVGKIRKAGLVEKMKLLIS